MPRTPRRQKLVQPGLQLPLVLSFVGLGVLALLLQFLVIGARLFKVAGAAAGSGGALADEVPAILIQALAFSVVVLVPVLFLVGLVLTHRIVGPIGRLERYLTSVARGETSEPCKLRASDKLDSLCHAINLATESVRAENEKRSESTSEAAPLREAS